MNRITANLLIVLAFLLLALAYRLKQNGHNCSQSKARPAHRLFGGTAHRRPGPGRLERLWLELTIIFTSARWGVLGV